MTHRMCFQRLFLERAGGGGGGLGDREGGRKGWGRGGWEGGGRQVGGRESEGQDGEALHAPHSYIHHAAPQIETH
jgi:hypothetical protein